MIKKKFFQFNKDWNRYTLAKNIPSSNVELGYLKLMLNPWEAEGLDVYIVEPSVDNTIFIYSENAFKEQADLEFATREESDAFEDAYIKYRNKREDEMPNIELLISDWEALKQKWKKIEKEQPEYVIFELDSSGPLDKVDVYGKDELSQEDMGYIQQGHEKYLKYEKARRKYIQNHPDYSYEWRGPQDDEYEADIMKYYDKD